MKESNTLLNIFSKEVVSNHYLITLNDEIGVASEYSELIALLKFANENDVIEIEINNNGGCVDTALQIPEYRSLGDVVRLYRVVGVTSMDEIKVNEPGEHYVLDEFQIHEESIGMYDWEDGLRAYIMEVDCPIGEIDVIRTLVQNMSFPNEWEISVKNKGNGVKVVNIREMG